MLNEALFSSNNDEWATPQDFYDKLNKEFGFRLDVCATVQNRKCSVHFGLDIGVDSLQMMWHEFTGPLWMNPPYGDPEMPCKPNCKKKRCQQRGYHIDKYKPGIIDWMRKAYEESRKGATVVCLVPSRTDTKWWHTYAMRGEIRFVQGRLKFELPDGKTGTAPFPSAVVIFRPYMTMIA